MITKYSSILAIMVGDKTISLTTHDSDILFEKVNYLASPGFTPSAIVMNKDFLNDNFEFESVIDEVIFKQHEVYDLLNKKLKLLIVDRTNMEVKFQIAGVISEVEINDSKFSAKVISEYLVNNQVLTEVFSPSCRASFGDKRCKIDLTQHKNKSCDKKFETCKSYNNILNFRGEPHVPTGEDLFG